MSREAFGDPPESQEPPDLCPVCGNDWHAEDCEFGKEVARRLKAERDAHRMQFALHRLWPALERAMAGMVFTADRAGEVQADMNTLREYSKTPHCQKGDGPCIRGCKGWECRDGWPDDRVTCGGGLPGDPNGEHAALAVEVLVRKYEGAMLREALTEAYMMGAQNILGRM